MPGPPAAAFLPRPRCPGAPSRVPRPPGTKSPDSDPARGGGWRERAQRRRADEGGVCPLPPAPTRSPFLRTPLGSRRRVTAALRLRRCAPSRPESRGVGLGFSRSDPGAALPAGGDAPDPAPHSRPRGFPVPDPPLSHLPGMRSGRSGRSQECPGAARGGGAHRPVARGAAGRGLAGPRPPFPSWGPSGPPRCWGARPPRRGRTCPFSILRGDEERCVGPRGAAWGRVHSV